MRSRTHNLRSRARKCATFRFQRFSHAVRSRESSGNRVCRGFLAINCSRVNRDKGESPYGRYPREDLGKPSKSTFRNPLFAGFPRCARGRRPYGDSPKSRLINSQKTYRAKIRGHLIISEGSEVQSTSCNGAVGAAEVRSKVLLRWGIALQITRMIISLHSGLRF